MNVTSRYLFLFLFGTVFISCNSSLTPSEYLTYFGKNRDKFTYTVTKNGVEGHVVYIPNNYYAALEVMNKCSLSVADARKKYEKSLFFVVSFEQNEKLPSPNQYFDDDGVMGFMGSDHAFLS